MKTKAEWETAVEAYRDGVDRIQERIGEELDAWFVDEGRFARGVVAGLDLAEAIVSSHLGRAQEEAGDD